MKTLFRNLRTFYYANVAGETALTDSQGYKTGEYEISYSTPTAVKGNISPAMGNAYESPFGITEGYDKVIVCDEPDLPITSTSVLWVDREVTEPYDYVVSRIARSINSISIAIKRVDVSAENNNG